MSVLPQRLSFTICSMQAARHARYFFSSLWSSATVAILLFVPECAAQQPLSASAARILLLPRRIVSGERATLAVLDVHGRLTPGVTINFSNGDRYTTDATGRALMVAPLNPGVIYGSIAGRTGRVATTILAPAKAESASVQVFSAPRVASITDRFELSGGGFCGDADANQVMIAGQSALVLASSPVSLIVLPPLELSPGPAKVEIACAKQTAPVFSITLLSLELETNSAPLAPGKHRALTVHVRGTTAKVELEARNLAPEIAELVGGNPVRLSSSGGAENFARFEVIGKQRGNFLISMRLIAPSGAPR
jgi:hypothetical protein